MLIESLIRRLKGTSVTLGTTIYLFQPDDEGRHVAEVDDPAHIATFLAIKEGFRSADGVVAPGAEMSFDIDGPFFIIRGPQDAKAFAHWAACIPDMLDHVDEHTLLIDKIALGEASLHGFQMLPEPSLSPLNATSVGAPPAAASPQPPADNTILPDQNQQEDADPGDDPAGDGGAGGAGDTGADTDPGDDGDEDEADEELDREALAKTYAEKHGHRPNGKWSAEKIAQVLAEQE